MSPAELKKQVSSPGGTTLAALSYLQEQGFHELLVSAIGAAKKRSQELSN